MSLPVVAIVGRPNVGKSTLFNRLARRRIAVVADEPGTTRDRVVAEVEEGERRFLLVDTGGLELDPETETRLGIRAQVDAAIGAADVLLFMADSLQGVTQADREVAQMLRATQKPVFLVVNKADNRQRADQALEFYELGLGDPLPVSANHGHGVAELMERVADALPPSPPPNGREERVAAAIVGRPNVGKSALLNALLGEERVVVSATPGTTRDAIDTPFEFQGTSFTLIDTAGIRRRGHVEQGVEQFSVIRSLGAINRAHVALLVVEATDPLTAQDLHIGGYIQEAQKGLVLVVNKWDLVAEARVRQEEVEAGLRARLKFVPGFPVVFTSALRGEGTGEVLEAAQRVYAARFQRVSTSDLNRLLSRVLADHNPPSFKGQRLSIYYGTQVGVDPPTFVLFVNHPERLHFSYRRYLENTLRREFGFDGTPIRLVLRARAREER